MLSKKQIKAALALAYARCDAELSQRGEGMYERGLSREGFAGGYLRALADVSLLLNGTMPDSRGYWGSESFLDSVIAKNKRKNENE